MLELEDNCLQLAFKSAHVGLASKDEHFLDSHQCKVHFIYVVQATVLHMC